MTTAKTYIVTYKSAFPAKVHRRAQGEPPTEQQTKQAQNAAKDKFGVTHESITYSETENKVSSRNSC